MPPSAQAIIHRLLVEDIDMSSAEIGLELKRRGVRLSPLAISTIRAHALSVLHILAEQGMLDLAHMRPKTKRKRRC
jgi:hypothetical protein